MSINGGYKHIKCRHCGTINNAGVVRCEKCGSDLDLYGDPIINDTDREEWEKHRKEESEKAAAAYEVKQREQERAAAEEKERERLAEEQRERERHAQEQREKERAAEEQRKNENESSDMASVRAEQERIRRLNEQKQKEDEKIKEAAQKKERRKKGTKKAVLIAIGVLLGIVILVVAIFSLSNKRNTATTIPVKTTKQTTKQTAKPTTKPTAAPTAAPTAQNTQRKRDNKLEASLYTMLNRARTAINLDEFDLDMHIDSIAYEYNNDKLTRDAEAPYDLPYNIYDAIKSDAGDEYSEVNMTILKGPESVDEALRKLLTDDTYLADEDYNSIGICVLKDEDSDELQWFILYAQKIDRFAGIR